jgi:ribosomal protein S27E
MAEDQPVVISPMCPDCHRKNVRFNKTDNAFVCNLCGRIGTRDEFVKTTPT